MKIQLMTSTLFLALTSLNVGATARAALLLPSFQQLEDTATFWHGRITDDATEGGLDPVTLGASTNWTIEVEKTNLGIPLLGAINDIQVVAQHISNPAPHAGELPNRRTVVRNLYDVVPGGSDKSAYRLSTNPRHTTVHGAHSDELWLRYKRNGADSVLDIQASHVDYRITPYASLWYDFELEAPGHADEYGTGAWTYLQVDEDSIYTALDATPEAYLSSFSESGPRIAVAEDLTVVMSSGDNASAVARWHAGQPGWTGLSGRAYGDGQLEILAEGELVFSGAATAEGLGFHLATELSTGRYVDLIVSNGSVSLDFDAVDLGLPADFNNDGAVDAVDFGHWQNSYGIDWFGDADGDRDADGADLLILQEMYSRTLEDLDVHHHPVPEPTSLAALTAGLMALLLRYHSRGRYRGGLRAFP